MNRTRDASALSAIHRPRQLSARPHRFSFAIAIALGCGSLNAWSPPFCGDDTFPLVPASVRSTKLPYRVFERLAPDQFPRSAGAVRMQVVSVATNEATVDSFHRRGENAGFASRVHARREFDERSGLRRMKIAREDDACMNAGISARVSPANALCAQLEAVELMRGAWTLNFRHALVNHQLQFTVVGSREAEGRWTMVPSRRRGEPELLQLDLGGDGDRLHARWTVVDASESERFEAALDVDTPSRDLAAARFDPFELGLLGSLDLLDELSDLHRDWVAYTEQVDTMEPVPEPGDDFYGCEPSDGVCSAEYDTCIPTENGWLGCNYDPTEPGWGGGLGDDDIGGFDTDDDDDNDPPAPLPDWQAGSILTNPPFPSPLFHGMHVDFDFNGNATHQGFSYQITSVLQRASTVPKPYAYSPHPLAGHVVGYFLTRDGSDQFICGLARLDKTAPSPIPVGHHRTYDSPDELCRDEGLLSCPLDSGIYVLHYNLDPTQQWDEGSDGEANNAGLFRGYHIED